MQEEIIIKGAYENSLKHVNIRIPKGKIVVFTGVSGSGKSSLVFDTIAIESKRQLNETFPAYIRMKMPRYEAPKAEAIDGLTTAIIIDQRPFNGNMRSTVSTMTDIAPLLRLLFSRCAVPKYGTASTAYSFNNPEGMCPECSGLGKTVKFDFHKVLDCTKSLNEGAIQLPSYKVGSISWGLYVYSGLYDPDKPLNQYSKKEWEAFMYGEPGAVVVVPSKLAKVTDFISQSYEGLEDKLNRFYLKKDIHSMNKTSRKILEDFTIEADCAVCHGARLNPKVLSSRLLGYNIYELGQMEIADLIPILEKLDDRLGKPMAEKILSMLHGIADMGLGYLNLNRTSDSLSGGEAQRLKMVRHLGSSLVGLTYIFDEPSAGLHPKDVDRLNSLFLKLKERGNSVLVVEHDKDIIRIADEVVDMGPLAGKKGGQVVFQGPLEDLLKQETLTAKCLRRRIPIKENVRRADSYLEIRDASLHNLKHVSVRIPKNVLTVISGLAGSGKSSLVEELQNEYPGVFRINQALIGLNSSSTPATYVGVMDDIRRLFARDNGVSASLFSANSEGACPMCGGKGSITTEMAFMDAVTMTCEACGGKKFSEEALQYRFNGLNILEVLDLSVDEAVEFFTETKIKNRLKTMQDVGLGYMTLGQPTATLSGGECKRVKLAAHLKVKNGIYAIDEPTTGLHANDIDVLMKLLNHIVDNGNTVIVVEHDLDVLKQADYVIDMGPEGGKNGGQVLFCGTPSELLLCQHSVTAEYLRKDVDFNIK